MTSFIVSHLTCPLYSLQSIFLSMLTLSISIYLGGPACADLTCTTSFAWFGNVDSNHATTIASSSVCAGVGVCNTTSGLCM